MKRIEKVIIAMVDDVTKMLTINCVKKLLPEAQIIDGSTDLEIYYYLHNADDKILLIFDRFFNGYILKYKLMYYRSLNEQMKIIFVEYGYCVSELGLRLYEAKADGFICEIEKEAEFTKNLNTIIDGGKYFPEVVKAQVDSGEKEDKKRISHELTDREYQIAIYKGKGFTNKEISFALGITDDCVRQHSSSMCRKIGWKSPNDLYLLNQRLAAFDIRSWHC